MSLSIKFGKPVVVTSSTVKIDLRDSASGRRLTMRDGKFYETVGKGGESREVEIAADQVPGELRENLRRLAAKTPGLQALLSALGDAAAAEGDAASPPSIDIDDLFRSESEPPTDDRPALRGDSEPPKSEKPVSHADQISDEFAAAALRRRNDELLRENQQLVETLRAAERRQSIWAWVAPLVGLLGVILGFVLAKML